MNANKKIFMVSTVHELDDVRIYHKYAKSLRKAKFDVYLCGQIPSNIDNNFKYIKIIGRHTNRLTRAIMGQIGCLKLILCAQRKSIIHFHDPELLPVMVLLKLIFPNIIYDCHENFIAQLEHKSYLNSWTGKYKKILITFVYNYLTKRINFVVCANHEIARVMKLRGVKNIVTVQNFVLREEIGRVTKYNSGSKDLLFIGAITKVRGIFAMLDFVNYLPSEYRLIIAGKFQSDDLLSECKRHPGWAKVKFLGQVNREKLSVLMEKAKAGLFFFHDIPNHRGASPNKLFEYFGRGLPVICSNEGTWQDVVKPNQLGYATSLDAVSLKATAENISSLDYEEVSDNCLRYAVKNSCWDNEFDNFINFVARETMHENRLNM
ncbi:glycosyltransferase [Planktomarina temperata]|nr:glycosyltransferase [Planktomarina temperata]